MFPSLPVSHTAHRMPAQRSAHIRIPSAPPRRRRTLLWLASCALVLAYTLPEPLAAQTRTGAATASDSAAPRASGGLATPSAVARDARSIAKRIGLWASAGGGRGSAGLSCPACVTETSPALMVHAAVGGQPSARFHVGVEFWAWLDVIGNGVDRTARGAQLFVRHYPLATERFFVTGGVGTSRFRVDDGEARFNAASPALSIGAGWDLPVRGVVLSPSLLFVASTGGALTSDRTGNSVADNARLGLWRSTIAITWF